MPNELTKRSSIVSFADIAHQTLSFDQSDPCDQLILRLIDTPWMQRLRSISQTGNTRLVYMFAEHTRFGHSLGVTYLAKLLMQNLKATNRDLVEPFEKAVASAALLHDIGHVAPGSHLGERVWSGEKKVDHEEISLRVIKNDPLINAILKEHESGLDQTVCDILSDGSNVPPWTKAIISGGGWNADRGNWAIVDSAMCCVSYGRYNVLALIDAFRLSKDQTLVIGENRSDALLHFFVARDSMYRQIYQHRVLQAADTLNCNIIKRIRDILALEDAESEFEAAKLVLNRFNIFADKAMLRALIASQYCLDLDLDDLYQMNEHWWNYHLTQWRNCEDKILRDLSSRLIERRLFKTIRVEGPQDPIIEQAKEVAKALQFDPQYYVSIIEEMDKHRNKHEESPMIVLDNGDIVPVTEIEPMIAQILSRPVSPRSWIAVPQEVKQRIGRIR